MASSPVRVVVLDDHALVASGLCQYLQITRPHLDVISVHSWSELNRRHQLHGCPHLVIADIWLADGNSLHTLADWRSRCPQTRWLALSGDDSPGLAAQVRGAGAQGFVHKQVTPETLGQVIDDILQGVAWVEAGARFATNEGASSAWPAWLQERGLTPRQAEIFALLLRGLPNKRIASELGIAESTVKEHVTELLSKLGVRTRIEAITWYQTRRQRGVS